MSADRRLAALAPHAHRMIRNLARVQPGLFEDAYQEGMIAAWEALQSKPDAPESYLMAAARNGALSRVLRPTKPMTGAEISKRYGKRISDEALVPLDTEKHDAAEPDFAADVVTATVVRAAVRRLEPKDREIVWLHFWKEVPQTEIQARLGVHFGDRWSRRIRPALADALAAA